MSKIDIGSLNASLGLDSKNFIVNMDKAAKAMSSDTAKMKKSMDDMEKTMKGVTAVAGGLGGAFVGMQLGRFAGDVLKMGDEYQTLQARIKNATKTTGDFRDVSNDLFKITKDVGGDMKTSVDVFQRMALGAKDLGKSNKEVLKAVRAVEELGVVSGTSTDALKHGLLQFGQGLSSGIFRAEEFNSVVENMPAVAQIIAEGFGMSVGQLRLMIIEGRIASKDVFEIMVEQSAKIHKSFQEMPNTMERSFARLYTSVSQLVGKLDEAAQATRTIADATSSAGNWLDKRMESDQAKNKFYKAYENLPGSYKQQLGGNGFVTPLLDYQNGFSKNGLSYDPATGKFKDSQGRVIGGAGALETITPDMVKGIDKNSILSGANFINDLFGRKGPAAPKIHKPLAGTEGKKGPEMFSPSDLPALQKIKFSTTDKLTQQQLVAIKALDDALAQKAVNFTAYITAGTTKNGHKEHGDGKYLDVALNNLNGANQSELLQIMSQLPITQSLGLTGFPGMGKRRQLPGHKDHTHWGIFDNNVTSIFGLNSNKTSKRDTDRAAWNEARGEAIGDSWKKNYTKERDAWVEQRDNALKDQIALEKRAGDIEQANADQNKANSAIWLEDYQRRKSVLQSVIGDTEGYNQRLKDLNQLVKDGAIAEKERLEAIKSSQIEFGVIKDTTLDAISTMEQAVRGFGQNFENTFMQAAKTGKFAFGDLTASILQDIAQIVLQMTVIRPATTWLSSALRSAMMGSVAGQTGESSFDAPGGIKFGNDTVFLASGGTAYAGKPHVVGEQGPELFIPGQTGTVVPNHALKAGGGHTVVINNHFSPGLQGAVKAEMMAMLPELDRRTEANVINGLRRGGKMAQAAGLRS